VAPPLRADRPDMPEGYGVPASHDGLLPWEEVERRLAASPQYWMATTRPDGSPHVVPRWGVWLHGRLWYDGSPATVHARNLRANPACVLHLEDGWESVIVEGRSEPSAPPGARLGERLAAAFAAKYRERGYAPAPDAWQGEDAGGLLVLTPFKAMAWLDFPNDVTRFTFRDGRRPPPGASPAQ
jgi:nitroimidazol reductase NimA-like FMN-containing flavoprotein (pyridoxamine 5'-phosphate oxidase superfamily)